MTQFPCGMKEAAAYLGYAGVGGLDYHIRKGNIVPRKISGRWIFTKDQLDALARTRRLRRPRKSESKKEEKDGAESIG